MLLTRVFHRPSRITAVRKTYIVLSMGVVALIWPGGWACTTTPCASTWTCWSSTGSWCGAAGEPGPPRPPALRLRRSPVRAPGRRGPTAQLPAARVGLRGVPVGLRRPARRRRTGRAPHRGPHDGGGPRRRRRDPDGPAARRADARRDRVRPRGERGRPRDPAAPLPVPRAGPGPAGHHLRDPPRVDPGRAAAARAAPGGR